VLDCGEHYRADQNLLSRVAATVGLARARRESASLLSQPCEALVEYTNASEYVFRQLAPPRSSESTK